MAGEVVKGLSGGFGIIFAGVGSEDGACYLPIPVMLHLGDPPAVRAGHVAGGVEYFRITTS